MIRYAAAFVVAAATVISFVQADTGKFGIGSPAPKFTNLPGVDGKDHSLAEYKKDVLVVCITCNHCPVAVAYEDRLVKFAKKFGDKIDFLAINVNNGDADKLDKMKIRAEQKGFTFPYLYDATQKVGHALSAHVTPEFYVFNKARKLVYWGSMDNSQNEAKVSKTFLDDAVTSVLSGQTPTHVTTKAFGCSVKYDK
jgi:peroxiredoxin